ncbi:MAG TPA: hypothetical protein VGG09_14135 [Acidimicrobiales bacterium]|jgi:hypothetical protein
MSTEDMPDEDVNGDPSREDTDVDEEEEESFPASDPPSTWSGSNSNLGE